ncbi:hypothetical protein RvY_15809-2 [Ramazzottius varieornatus]|uniref:Sialin n=1 Tax=Ramazzottius varieornatus TaxID=947166 RepID=A0A1D1VXP5_RAMVA|nr:hypothetical protein RvY_15809-2 [Ramazzottius varieornatus]
MEIEDAMPVPRSDEKRPWIPVRYLMVILAFFGFCNLYALRVNMSIAIVSMVITNSSNGESHENTGQDVCPHPNKSSSSHVVTGEFVWDSQTQGIILGSFFYGYIFTQLAGAEIAKRYGPKHPFGFSVLISGLLALLIPTAARWSTGALITIRTLQGFFQGVCFPSMHSFLGNWAPTLERTKMATIAYSGTQTGTVISLLLSGWIAEWAGWEWIFYTFGACACVWYLFWVFLAFDSPERHPSISQVERAYIVGASGKSKVVVANPSVPWRKIFLSLPVWAICVAHFGNNWGFYTLLTNLSTYFSTILHFSLKENGFLSALPYLAMAVFMPICGYFADSLRSFRVLSTTGVRKVFHVTGQLLPAVCLVSVGYVGCNSSLAVALLVLAVASSAFAQSGYQVNHVDISPNFAGILMGISNTLATVPGIVGPYVVGLITSSSLGQLEQWRLVFFISAGVYVVTAIFYAIFASGELESWERKTVRDDVEEDRETLPVYSKDPRI